MSGGKPDDRFPGPVGWPGKRRKDGFRHDRNRSESVAIGGGVPPWPKRVMEAPVMAKAGGFGHPDARDGAVPRSGAGNVRATEGSMTKASGPTPYRAIPADRTGAGQLRAAGVTGFGGDGLPASDLRETGVLPAGRWPGVRKGRPQGAESMAPNPWRDTGLHRK